MADPEGVQGGPPQNYFMIFMRIQNNQVKLTHFSNFELPSRCAPGIQMSVYAMSQPDLQWLHEVEGRLAIPKTKIACSI